MNLSDSIRTSKTVGSTKTECFLNGSQILAQKTGSNVIPYYYDANGTRIAFKYNGTMYYYVYNLQGDVTHKKGLHGKSFFYVSVSCCFKL